MFVVQENTSTHRLSRFKNTATWREQARRLGYQIVDRDNDDYLIAYDSHREPVGAMPKWYTEGAIQFRGWMVVHF